MDEKIEMQFSTGILAIDEILQGVLPGDNIVFQVDEIGDYKIFVKHFCVNANKENKDLIYCRFAQHEYLIPKDVKVTVYELNPKKGFDFFLSEIINLIEIHGTGACYVFDSLSDLTVDWYSDVMLGNFYMLVCPYLYDFKTVAFFALFRHYHDSTTFKDIHNTSQVVIDVYHDKDNTYYIHPLKVFNRFTPTIFMLHKCENLTDPKCKFKTIKESAIISKVLSEKHYLWLDYSIQHIDAWHLTFQKAQETLEGLILGEISLKQSEKFKKRLLKKIITQDERLFTLAMNYFDLEDLLTIRKRMIGTGFIGGKALGMLLARKIIKIKDPLINNKMEIQDSFYVGTEVFYTYLVKNDCWWMRRRLSNPDTFLEGLEETQQRIFSGTFPDYLIERFIEILDYFGQAPIIVRSSSLQEDAYGNSFSGKYESVFLANQGTPEERLKDFINAVKVVYASAGSKDALIYRRDRNLLDKDEQMAILVQRVSGSMYGKFFFPQVAGVGLSFNPYVWNKSIDPNAGVLRLVVGLGTRAVNRIEDDFTRLVALNKPLLRVHATLDETQEYSQKKVDVLDLERNALVTGYFFEIESVPELLPYLDLVASRNFELEEQMRRFKRKKNIFSWVLTFYNLLEKTQFAGDMMEMLKILEDAYQHPVDIEFTLNFFDNLNYNINLVQCRHFHINNEIRNITAPKKIDSESIIIKTKGPIIGNSIATRFDRIIYVDPSYYAELSLRDRYSIARLIGKINQLEENLEKKILLLGPGRWGTSSPSVGIPTSFAEINNVSVLCEIAEKTGAFIPDVSLGTHFFNNLVELDILYFVLYPEKEDYFLDRDYFQNASNCLPKLIPDSTEWVHVLKVIDLNEKDDELILNVNMNSFTQMGICYFNKNIKKAS